jgi:hypothetical protein
VPPVARDSFVSVSVSVSDHVNVNVNVYVYVYVHETVESDGEVLLKSLSNSPLACADRAEAQAVLAERTAPIPPSEKDT